GESGERQRRPLDAELLAAAGEDEAGGVHLMRAIGIAPAPPAPGIADRPGHLQRLLGFLIIRFELVEADRPVARIAELRARLEPFRAPAECDHGVVDGGAADAAARII